MFFGDNCPGISAICRDFNALQNQMIITRLILTIWCNLKYSFFCIFRCFWAFVIIFFKNRDCNRSICFLLPKQSEVNNRYIHSNFWSHRNNKSLLHKKLHPFHSRSHIHVSKKKTLASKMAPCRCMRSTKAFLCFVPDCSYAEIRLRNIFLSLLQDIAIC